MRAVITNVLLLGIASAFLVHFVLIGIYGYQIIAEPNPVILRLEIVGMFAVVLFALVNLKSLAGR
ncbi:hypothetical protein ES708_33196 [subsurface metagenome]